MVEMLKMSGSSSCLFLFPLSSLFLLVHCVSSDVNIITAEPGQKVSLPCEVTVDDISIRVVQWNRPYILINGYVLLYRNGQIDTDYQLESFQGRVSLPDKWMETGNVSLILENVKDEDSGTYECRVKLEGEETKTISNIRLTVETAGQKGGQSGGDEEGGNEGGVSRGLVVGSVVGLLLVGVMIGGVVVVLYKNHQRKNSSSFSW